MSYDLFVFDPAQAPKSRAAVLEWYGQLMDGDELHFLEPTRCSPNLKDWFAGMVESFPPLNGELAPKEFPEDESILTDYSFGPTMIYACFAWSKVEEAYKAVVDAADKARVGFCDISSESAQVWIPSDDGFTEME